MIPVLEAPQGVDSPLFESSDAGVFDEARLVIQEALRCVRTSGVIPAAFPPNALREFSRFGRSLQEGECISFDEGTSHEATYSQEIRRTIQEIARLERFEVETLVIGQITGVYADEATFKIRLARNGRVITGRFSSDDIVPDLRQYLDVSAMAPTVAVSSVAIQSINNEIIEIQDVLNVEPVLPADWSRRLTELSRIESGWLEGAGEAVNGRVLRQVELLLLELLDIGVERPSIYPTEAGGVQLEWSSDRGEVTAEVTRGEEVDVFGFSKNSDEELAETFSSNQLVEAAQCLLGEIQQYAR
ncbi:hypothetical protein [Streptomyces sp. NPDC055085]